MLPCMFADVNGIRINYKVHGEGEPLVLIGRFGANLKFWHSALEYIDGYRVVEFDNCRVGTTEYFGGSS